MNKKKLYRNRDSLFLGVLSGCADYMHWDKSILRIIFVILLFTTGFFPFGLAYLILAMILKKNPYPGSYAENSDPGKEELAECDKSERHQDQEGDWDRRFYEEKN